LAASTAQRAPERDSGRALTATQGLGMNFLPSASFLLRRLPALSVRVRILTLAFIPVVGLGIMGIFFANGERNVGAAFG
jgi:hypothetical protein